MNIERLTEIVKETDKIFFDEALRSDVKEKGDSDYVTRADIAISDYLKKRLAEEFPSVGFVSEEADTNMDESGDYFILDPIDGTTNFMHGLPWCGVSLGFYSNGKITAGVIYIPYTGELFSAQKGCGAYLNGERIYCSKKAHLCECAGFYEFNAYFKKECGDVMEYAKRIYLSMQGLRCLGSVAVELAYIACGKADVFFGTYLKPWDYAAAVIILEEAGGKLTRIGGEFSVPTLNVNIAAANAEVFDEFTKLIESPTPHI